MLVQKTRCEVQKTRRESSLVMRCVLRTECISKDWFVNEDSSRRYERMSTMPPHPQDNDNQGNYALSGLCNTNDHLTV